MSLLPRGARAAPRTDRQEEVLDQLEALFARDGFRAFTLSDLSTRLSCSRRTLYELAESKDDLVALVAERFLDRNFRQGIDATRDLGAARERLRAFTTAVIADAGTMSRAFADDLFSSPRTASLVDNYDQRCTTWLENLLRDGQAAREFRTLHPTLAANSLMASIARIQDPAVLTEVGLSYLEAAAQVVDLFLDGIDHARMADR